MLSLPSELCIEALNAEASSLVVTLSTTTNQAPCTLCQTLAWRVHSRYIRTLADLPCSGQTVILRWQVRKWFCPNPACARKIFTEQLPAFIAPSARMTQRLVAALQAIAGACGGALGSRLATHLSMPSSPTTLLRRFLALPLPELPPIRVLGVDDWAWKRRQRYGTLIVDQERACVSDLLAERSTDCFARWLAAHPSVELITRDRSSEYAKAATEAAPQAVQVADRFHLVGNLVEMLALLLARCRTEIRGAEQGVILPEAPEPALPTPTGWKPRNPEQAARAAAAHDVQRADRYQQVLVLRSHGLTWEAVAKRMGLSPKTIRKWMAHEGPPVHALRGSHRPGKFGPYARYVLERWQAGIHDGPQLYQEIAAQGYRGTLRTLQRYLQTLRRQRRPVDLGPPSVLDAFAARKAVWLFIKPPDELTAEEASLLEAVRAASPTASTAYRLAQRFMLLLHRRQASDLLPWLEELEATGFPEFQRFADGLRRDLSAVLAGIESPYSNGRTEGFVNKLKTVKRQMYGRAGAPLLRHRLLLAA